MAEEEETLCGCCTSALISLGIIAGLVLAFTNGNPVKVTVEEASLEQLALVAAGNGTASVAYNLSFTVAVRNPNSATRVWRTAPLDAELRLAGQPFALVPLAAAETERIRPLKRSVYRVAAAAAKSTPMALGSDAVAAFATETVVGTFRLEVVVSGEFKNEGQLVSFRTTVRCPLRLPLSTATTAAAFAAFEHTLPPQECGDLEQVPVTN